MHTLVFLILGLIVGAIARVIVSGREPGGWVVSMILGVTGSMLGGYLGQLAGMYRAGQPAGFVMSIIGACIVVVAYQWLTNRRAIAR